MRAVLQRVKGASVEIEGREVGAIAGGLLVLLGIKQGDTEKDCDYLIKKILKCRIFDDPDGVMNESLLDQKKSLLLVSQFTLYGDTRKGNRPSYMESAKGEEARPLYEYFIQKVKDQGVPVATGEFGADMDVHLINDGPVTILMDSEKIF